MSPFNFHSIFLFCVALTMHYNLCQLLNPEPFRHPTYLCIVCWSIAFLIWCNFISIIKPCLFRFYSRSFMLTFLYDHFILQRRCLWNYSWFICNQRNSVTKWQKAQIALRRIENIWRKCCIFCKMTFINRNSPSVVIVGIPLRGWRCCDT